ncbi:hypothetical protein HPB50_009394 [Hyalomma asiaticum]|uniref:Uncharacterized protein n=1 Tax=Hyalomma asiaticum TaxID=266040 RepID=A0ACB7TFQ4_HYAAI|nr:hypothetical protein HPB50_009394 [Hyalomma asiaticum]
MIVKVIQEVDLGDRIQFRYFHVGTCHFDTCGWQDICSVSFNTIFFELSPWFGGEPQFDRCRMVSRRGTTVKFNVWCSWMFQPDVEEWFTWLAESSTLTYVQIFAVNHPGKDTCDMCAELCAKVVSAIAKNTGIVTLTLTFFKLGSEHIDMFCHCANEHRSLTEVTLTPYCPRLQACPIAKCSELSEEFRVAALKLQDIVRENASRIPAAAKFVLGEETRDGACAVEEMSNHPQLVEQVRHDGDVSNADAQVMVKRTVSTLRNCDVHKYMRLAGVVRGQQLTPLDPNVQQHILTLPLDCWLHIRRYLKIADVSF